MTSGHQRGFTLTELIIFIVVVGIGITGVLSVMDNIIKSSADPMVRKQTIAIAESLLEEISLKAYANPTDGYTGHDRAQFDDISDYVGYSTSTGIVDVLGASVTGLGNYNISPPVSVVPTSDLPGVSARKITVFVTGPGDSISLTGYRSND